MKWSVATLIKRENYIVIFALIFVVFFVLAAILIKATFPELTGGQSAVTARKEVQELAGHYVGFTTLRDGICSVGERQMAIDIAADGTASSTYGMTGDKVMRGHLEPNFKIALDFRGTVETSFKGEMISGHIYGRTAVSNDPTCKITWDLYRTGTPGEAPAQ